MKLIVCALALVALTQAFDDVDWSKVQSRHVYPELPEGYRRLQRIIGGFEATPNSIPYQVGIVIATVDGTFFCGGSLISRKFVMTAAHCVDGGFAFQVRLGAHRIDDNEATQVRIWSTTVVIHPGWYSGTLQDDIAVIELPDYVDLNDNIQPIGLPTWADAENDFTGSSGRLSGWGRDSDQAAAISPVLRYVFANVLSPASCADIMGSIIRDGHICTDGTGTVGGCHGDSGGPLVVDNKQLGVVSFGTSLGCEFSYPSVFTRVTYYLDWLDQNTDVLIN